MPPLGLNLGLIDSHFEGKGVGERIVGTWHVSYTSGGVQYAQAFISMAQRRHRMGEHQQTDPGRQHLHGVVEDG